MSGSRPDSEIIATLGAAVDAPGLPPRAREAGERLLERLTSPVRVALLGHPSSGKSQLLNLIVGERIVPPGARLPTLELRHGPARRTTFVLADGTESHRDGLVLPAQSPAKLQIIRLEAPIPILRKITLVEVVSYGGAESERFGVVWASERADIVLWCTQDFTLAEEWLWSAMPDRLKDHGFLVLTKADELIRKGTLQARLDALADVVAEEFHSLFPVATLQGLAAIGADGTVAEDAFAASGGRALVSAILGHVEQGRRADIDGALMFLSRFADALPEIALPVAPGDLAAEVAEADAAATAPAAPASPAPHPVAEPAPQPAPEPAPQPVADIESDPDDADETGRARIEAALDQLAASAANLGRTVADGDDTPSAILASCAEAAEDLAGLLGDEPPATPAFARAHEDVLETSEKLVLLQLEKGDGPAADAVTLLLQLRRSLAQSLAA